MAVCSVCESEMTTADHCTGGIELDPEIASVFANQLRRCHDCHVVPGACHHPGCDMERCGNCGGQAISCGCGEDNPEAERVYWVERPNNRWMGVQKGYLECFKLGWFCRDLHLDGSLPTPENPMKIGRGNMRWHDPCAPTDEGANPDLNRWHRAGCPTGEALDKLLSSVG